MSEELPYFGQFFGAPTQPAGVAGKPIKRAASAFRANDVTRAIKAAAKAGLSVTRTEIAADGTICLVHGAISSESAFDAWKEHRGARST